LEKLACGRFSDINFVPRRQKARLLLAVSSCIMHRKSDKPLGWMVGGGSPAGAHGLAMRCGAAG
jgi:hypothetical protein